jgi:pimeloyl-ACP methyl ester carboxylesterase
MARIVLVHGAFHEKSCWDSAKVSLESRGHGIETLDLPGHGEDTTPLDQVTLQVYADRVVQQLASDPEPAVLVGHSMGGMVVTQAADDFLASGGELAQVIYASAFLPEDGQSLVDLAGLPEGAGDMVQANVQVSGEPPIGVLSTEHAIAAFYGECDAAVAQAAAASLGPQPILAFVMPVSIDNKRQVTRRYVITGKDKALPTALQRRLAQHPSIVEVAEIDTDHSAFLSRTDEFVDIIDRFARS